MAETISRPGRGKAETMSGHTPQHPDPLGAQEAVRGAAQEAPGGPEGQEGHRDITPASTAVETPSGLKGTIRRLRLRELNILANRKLAKSGTSITELLRSVWTETTDPGIYRPPFLSKPWPEDSHGSLVPRWDQVLIGDRTAVLLAVRELSRGPEFSFEVTCQAPACRRPIPWTVDLRNLERHGLSEEARAKLTGDGENLFYRTLPYSGDKVAFRLLTGADEAAVARVATDEGGEAMVSASMLLRLPYLGGGLTSPSERRRFVEEMDLEDASWLQGQWEEADIKVQQEIEVECPHCWRVQPVAIPFDADFFWRRSSRR